MVNPVTTESNHLSPLDLLAQARAICEERTQHYGDPASSYRRAAQIASYALNRVVHPYEVLVMMRSVKEARAAVNPGHLDSQIDGINFQAFIATFAEDYALWLSMQELEQSIGKTDPRQHDTGSGATAPSPDARARANGYDTKAIPPG